MVFSKRLTYILVAIPVLLLIPLVAMQFTDEVHWSLADFLLLGALLLLLGLALEWVLRKVHKSTHRWILILGLLFVFALILAELAVGLLGTPFAGN